MNVRTRILTIAVAAVVVAAGIAIFFSMGSDGSESSASRSATASGSARSDDPPTPPDDTAGDLVSVQGVDDRVGTPVRVRVPRLDIDSRLDDLEVDSTGELERPPEWQVAGWYADGPRPGQAGPAVIAGHVDSPSGPAVFARLSEVRQGDEIEVTDVGGATRTFVVTGTEITPKEGFPTKAVYGPTPDSQLRLITCDGPYLEGSGGYQDNLLVYATAQDDR